MIEDDIKEKREFYEMLLKGKEVYFKRNLKSMTEEYLFPVFKNKHFNSLLKYALDIRSKKRIKEYGAFDGEYKIPKKILKLEDIQNNPDIVDKFIENSPDSDSE
jgi:hypothetical protein